LQIISNHSIISDLFSSFPKIEKVHFQKLEQSKNTISNYANKLPLFRWEVFETQAQCGSCCGTEDNYKNWQIKNRLGTEAVDYLGSQGMSNITLYVQTSTNKMKTPQCKLCDACTSLFLDENFWSLFSS
jgi:hypothetical protein